MSAEKKNGRKLESPAGKVCLQTQSWSKNTPNSAFPRTLLSVLHKAPNPTISAVTNIHTQFYIHYSDPRISEYWDTPSSPSQGTMFKKYSRVLKISSRK